VIGGDPPKRKRIISSDGPAPLKKGGDFRHPLKRVEGIKISDFKTAKIPLFLGLAFSQSREMPCPASVFPELAEGQPTRQGDLLERSTS
jgi:hypothetical protein